MKNQTNHRLQTVLLAAIAIVLLLGVTSSTRAQEKYPKPDFSAMEKWYEIVKYEYGDPAGSADLTIFLKPKFDANNRPNIFWVEFRDKDGVLVGTRSRPLMSNLSGAKVGEVSKALVYYPPESEMEKVVTVTVIRQKN